MAADARRDILPSYLRLAPGEEPPPATHQAEMMAMKAREVEHVRFRSVRTNPGDLDLEAAMALMRRRCLDYITVPGDPGSARDPYMDIKQIMGLATGLDLWEFFHRAHQRSLGVVPLRDDPSSRVGYIDAPALLSDFPDSTVGKVAGQLDTEQGRAKAIVQLVNKHPGEVVDVDPNMTFWTLRLKSGPGAASSDSEPVHPQLFCVDGGSRSATATSASMAAGRRGFASTWMPRLEPSPESSWVTPTTHLALTICAQTGLPR